MEYLKMIAGFLRASIQEEMAYRANFLIRVLVTLLNFVSGIAGLWILFGQVDEIHGWDMPSALALYGVYLTLQALRDLFIGPSFDTLAGMDGEIWTGGFDFTVLKPASKLFLVSFRRWRILSVLDLLLAMGVLITAVSRMSARVGAAEVLSFFLMLFVGAVIFYSIMLIFTSLVLWNPGFLFTWLFNGLYQLARYPVGIYPGWLRLILTWIIPMALMTTFPAQALRGELSLLQFVLELAAGLALLGGAILLFHRGLRRYASASS